MYDKNNSIGYILNRHSGIIDKLKKETHTLQRMGEWDHMASVFYDFVGILRAMNDLVVQPVNSSDGQLGIRLG